MHKELKDLLLVVLLAMAAAVFLLSGCKMVKLVNQDIITKDSVSYKDTTIYVPVPSIRIPGDTVKLQVKVPCPDANWKGSAKSGRTAIDAELKGGDLSVKCKTDSLVKVIDSLEVKLQEKQTHTISVVTTTVKVPERYTPWWMWLIIILEGLFILTLGSKIMVLISAK